MLQVRIGLCHAPPAQRDAAGEQVRLHRLADPGRVETDGNILGIAEQSGGMLTRGVPRLGQHESGACLPAGPPLRPEQPTRLTRLLSGIGRVARSQGGGSGREEQFRLLERDPSLRRQPAEGGIGLLC